MIDIVERMSKTYFTNAGQSCKIIEYYSPKKLTIRIEDGTVIENIFFGNLIKGKVKNRNFKRYSGVGYIGYGKYNVNHRKALITWGGDYKKML